MEIIKLTFFLYLQCLGSWWWLLLCGITLISVIIFSLRDYDNELSLFKALQLSIVGLLNIVPVIREVVPVKLRIDFVARWVVLGLNSFQSFVLTIFICSFLAAPLMFIVIFGIRLVDQVMSGPCGYDAGKYGIINAIRLKCGANPKTLNTKSK